MRLNGSTMTQYTKKIEDILSNKVKYHVEFYRANNFTGPSLYFHRRALELRRSQDRLRYIESIYATLASWGMHRMGPTGAKMVEMAVFQKSVENLWKDIEQAGNVDCRAMAEKDWTLLKKIFLSIAYYAGRNSFSRAFKSCGSSLAPSCPTHRPGLHLEVS